MFVSAIFLNSVSVNTFVGVYLFLSAMSQFLINKIVFLAIVE